MNDRPTVSGLRGIMLVPCLVAVSLPRSVAGEVGPIVARIKAADGGAARAWRELSQLGPAQVPAMLAALDGAEASAAAFPALETASSTELENFYRSVKALTDLLKTDLFGAGSPLNLKLPMGIEGDTD